MIREHLPNTYNIFIQWEEKQTYNIKPSKALNKYNSATIKFVIPNEVNLFNTKNIFPTQEKRTLKK